MPSARQSLSSPPPEPLCRPLTDPASPAERGGREGGGKREKGGGKREERGGREGVCVFV